MLNLSLLVLFLLDLFSELFLILPLLFFFGENRLLLLFIGIVVRNWLERRGLKNFRLGRRETWHFLCLLLGRLNLPLLQHKIFFFDLSLELWHVIQFTYK